MGTVGKTVVLSGLIENENAEALSELFAIKTERVCVFPCLYWICSEMLNWERGHQTGALGVAGGDKLQAICVIRFSNMENASEYGSGLILSAELATPGRQGGDMGWESGQVM